jgi:type II secretory pathway pseudopilin PulG
MFMNLPRRAIIARAPAPRAPAPRAPRRRAFTLVETTLTTIIVGLAITALVKLVLTSTQQNRYTQRLTIGCLLAENCREMMANLPFCDPAEATLNFGPETGEVLATYNDVDDFDGFDSTVRPDLATGSPVGVVDAARRVITTTVNGVQQVPAEWANWRQQVAVDPVDPNSLGTVFPKPDTTRNCVRITVTIGYLPPGEAAWQIVTQLRWVKTR